MCSFFQKKMTNNHEELIKSFEKKVNDLKLICESLEKSKKELELELKGKTKELNDARAEISILQKDYDHLRMARYLNVSPKQRKISKQYIDGLVREIDKCLALLDE